MERITSYDNATVGGGSVVNEVQMAYNGFQQLVAEYQEHGGAVNISSTPKVQYAYADGSANRARLRGIVYPYGGLLRYEYNSGHDDHLSRVSFLADDNGGGVGTHLAEYAYLGLNVFVKVDYTEPQIRYDLAAGAGDDPYDGLDRSCRTKRLHGSRRICASGRGVGAGFTRNSPHCGVTGNGLPHCIAKASLDGIGLWWAVNLKEQNADDARFRVGPGRRAA